MIRALGEDVRSLLRSGIAVSNLTQCIDELVVNSLDAGATCVTVRVDIPVLQLQVSDNGTGISRDNLVALGERYATSKCHSLNDLNDVKFYGFRGEALASIREVAGSLEIVTRHKSSYKTYCKTFRNDKAVEITESCIPRSGVGTTVTVYEMFSSLPVRRKLVSDILDFERIRQRVASIALMNPGVSFSLFNDANGQKSLQTRKSQSIVSTFSQLFGNLKAKSLQELNLVNGDLTVSGFVGLKTHHSKHLQFVYVNGRPLMKTRIHKLINQVLAKSLLIKKPLSSVNENEEQNTVKSPPKQVCDKHSIYIINITCPFISYDITFEPSKTLVEFEDWESVLGLIKKCLESFLVKKNLMLSADTEEGDLAECQDSGSDNNDSQIDLSIYEYQTDTPKQTAKPTGYLINPDKIKKSLLSSVVSRSKKRDEDEVNAVRDTTELTDKEEMLDKVEPDMLSLKETHCLLQKGEDTSQRTASLSNPQQQPGRNTSLPGKGFGNTCRRSSCFNSPNPITLNQRKTQKKSDSRTKNFPDHNYISLVNPRKQFKSPDMTDESPSKIIVNKRMERKSCCSPPRSSVETNQCLDLDKVVACERGINQKIDGVINFDYAVRNFDIVVSHEEDGVCDKDLDEVMQKYESIADRGKLTTASRSKPRSRDGQTDDLTSTLSSHWQVTYDHNLQKNIYYNTRTGNTVFECPVNNLTDQEMYKESTVPMACAPHLSFDCTPWLPRDSRQRRKGAVESSTKKQEGSATLLSTMLNEWKNPVFETVSEMDVTNLSKPSVARNSLQKAILSYRFTKEMVKTLCVINQIDNKFIVCKAQGADNEHDSLVVLLDQHAVHERIRLEKLTEDLFVAKHQPSDSLPSIKSCCVSPPIEIEFTQQDLVLIKLFRRELARVGIKFVIGFESESSKPRSIIVHELPCIFVEREVSETRRRRPSVAEAIVKELVETHVEHLKQTSGVPPVIPKTVLRLLSSQACHGAIKFGESLTLSDCQSLIQQLSTCDLPFQCAHGRPSIIPLVNLNLLESRILQSKIGTKLPRLSQLSRAIK